MSVGCSTVGFMKILHTSDWHIGRTFHGVDLLADQASVLGSIADSVREHGVDVVVVPGDIYDRSIPSSDAVTVCNRGFEAIRAAGGRSSSRRPAITIPRCGSEPGGHPLPLPAACT